MIPIALLGEFYPQRPCILFVDDVPSWIADFYDNIFAHSALKNEVNFLGVERAKWTIQILESQSPVKLTLYRLPDNTVVQCAYLRVRDIAVVIADISFGDCRRLTLSEVGVDDTTVSEDAVGDQGQILYAGEVVCAKASDVGIPALIITQQATTARAATRIQQRGHAKDIISRARRDRQESLDILNRWYRVSTIPNDFSSLLGELRELLKEASDKGMNLHHDSGVTPIAIAIRNGNDALAKEGIEFFHKQAAKIRRLLEERLKTNELAFESVGEIALSLCDKIDYLHRCYVDTPDRTEEMLELCDEIVNLVEAQGTKCLRLTIAETHRIGEILNDAVTAVRTLCQQRGVELEFDSASEEEFDNYFCAPVAFMRALNFTLDNAYRRAREKVRITFNTDDQSHCLRIVIANDGETFRPADIPRTLNPTRSVGDDSVPTGLTAVVRDICELHAFNLFVRSQGHTCGARWSSAKHSPAFDGDRVVEEGAEVEFRLYPYRPPSEVYYAQSRAYSAR